MIELQDGHAKYTKVQRRRLILALAYINTHRKEWNQSAWRCGTGMCLAGHIAVTISPSKPLVPMPDVVKAFQIQRKAVRTSWDSVPAEERDFYIDVNNLEDFLSATSKDDPNEIQWRSWGGKEHKVVSVAARARSLIGDLADFTVRMDEGDIRHMFNGDNKYSDLVKIAAAALGITQTELRNEIADAVQTQGWDRKVNA